MWDDPARGQQLTTELSRLRADIERFESLAGRIDDAMPRQLELVRLENLPDGARARRFARPPRQVAVGRNAAGGDLRDERSNTVGERRRMGCADGARALVVSKAKVN